MFDGRHCLEKDLKLLIKETDNIKNILSRGDKDVNNKLINYLKLIERFDEDIASQMVTLVKCASNDYEKIIKIIDYNVDILKQNVIVDINEHRK